MNSAVQTVNRIFKAQFAAVVSASNDTNKSDRAHES